MAEKSQNKAVEVETVAPSSTAGAVAAGRLQPGEKAEGLSTRPARGVAEPAADAKAETEAGGVAAVQEHVKGLVDEDNARGYRGVQVDSTPNSHYTVAGVTSGKPTPETVIVTPKGA